MRIYDVNITADQRPAGRREVREPVLFVGVAHRAFGVGRGGHRTGLSEPVTRPYFAVESLLHPGDQLGRRCRPAHGDYFHARSIVLSQLRTIEESVGHGGDQGHASGLFFLDESHYVGRFEAADHDVLASRQGDALRTSPAVGVKQRDGVEFYAAVIRRQRDQQTQRVQVKRAMREHHALGSAGAAAGVEKLGDFIFVEGK